MKTAVVRPSVYGVNVRENPTVRSKSLDAIEPGHEVEITKESGNWYYIKYDQAGKACEGWSIRSAFEVKEEKALTPLGKLMPSYWAVFIAVGGALAATVGALLAGLAFLR